ncbi:MAG: hypothetical protein KGI78_03895 [Patescibacteria group bacterium]|nr:hypothetical protein [Patescibacteria group bacterium]MDE1944128.1 hypothetical protein [Patescibacteria group bacterium]MDE1944749.1 hypothetical protein [Patescibacteria group bacterium]MDE2057965.1 hypothetical protein [Patescibacteria group bacterium]
MKTSVVAPILATCALVAALAVYASSWSSVGAAKAAVADLARKVEAASAESVRLASIDGRLASLGTEAGTIDNYFVPEADVADFINELETRGKEAGAAISIASVAAVPATGAAHPALSIAVTIRGSFDAVLRALGSIEYSPHALSVTSAAVAAAPDGKSWTASANLLVGATPGGAARLAPAAGAPAAAASAPRAATTTAPHPL